MADLGTMLDKIVGYKNLLKLHGYVDNGEGGVKPWSQRNSKGTSHIDVRNSEWTAYDGDREVCSGPDVESLSQFLNGDYKNGGGL